MNIIVKMQVDKLIKLNKCDMEDIGKVSSLASEMGMKPLINQLYKDQTEYLEYIRKKKKDQ